MSNISPRTSLSPIKRPQRQPNFRSFCIPFLTRPHPIGVGQGERGTPATRRDRFRLQPQAPMTSIAVTTGLQGEEPHDWNSFNVPVLGTRSSISHCLELGGSSGREKGRLRRCVQDPNKLGSHPGSTADQPTTWPWGSFLTWPRFNFLIYKTEIFAIAPSWARWEENRMLHVCSLALCQAHHVCSIKGALTLPSYLIVIAARDRRRCP